MFASFSLSRSLTSSNTVEDKIPDETNDSQVKSISSVQLWSEGGGALIELKCIAVINANWHGCASHGFPRVQEPSIYVSLKSAMQIVGGCWKREIWTRGWNFQNLWAGFKPSRCCQYGGCHQVIFKSQNLNNPSESVIRMMMVIFTVASITKTFQSRSCMASSPPSLTSGRLGWSIIIYNL